MYYTPPVAAISSKQWADDMASAEQRSGAEPPAGSRGRAPGQGIRGAKPPEAEKN